MKKKNTRTRMFVPPLRRPRRIRAGSWITLIDQHGHVMRANVRQHFPLSHALILRNVYMKS